MHTCNQLEYLAQMEIPSWQAQRVLPGAKQSVDFVGYALHNAADKKIGVLCLESSHHYPDACSAENMQLLDNMLTAIQCRRAPLLETQITATDQVILMMGEKLAQAALDSDAPLAVLRVENIHTHPSGAQLVVTYPPAHLRDTPADKAKAWEDLKKARLLLLQ